MVEVEYGKAICPHCSEEFKWTTMPRQKLLDGPLVMIPLRDRVVEIRIDNENRRFFSTDCPKCGRHIDKHLIDKDKIY